MTTLRKALEKRGYTYTSELSDKAEDILFEDTSELCNAIGYIARNISQLEGQYPEEFNSWNLPITDGVTSGGYKVKWGKQNRIYLDSTRNCPPRIRERLHQDSRKRFGGSFFVEALLCCGFVPGYAQNIDYIRKRVYEIFNKEKYRKAFEHGFALVDM
jgi:hypothetical protein